MPCLRLLAFGLVLAHLPALGCQFLQSTGRLLVFRSCAEVLSLSQVLFRERSVSKRAAAQPHWTASSVFEKQVPTAWILVSMRCCGQALSSPCMLVAGSQGYFAISL